MNTMIYRIVNLTVGISILFTVIGSFFYANFKLVLASLALGTLTSLLSFFMIVISTKQLSYQRGLLFYFLRFGINGLALVFGFYCHLPIGFVILGLFTHKLAVIIYGLYFKEV